MKRNFIGNYFSLMIFTMLFLLGGVVVLPSNATIAKTPNFIVNSMELNLIDITNDSQANGISYSYNISSSDTTNFTLQVEIYRYDGIYTYLYYNTSKNVMLNNNTITDSMNYNFSLSGSYNVKVYWFSTTNEILYYKEYSNLPIIGLNQFYINNPTHTNYEYWWHWQLEDQKTNYYQRMFNFSIDFYFYDQYNVSLNYDLTLYKVMPDLSEVKVANVSKIIQMTGKGDTFQYIDIGLMIDQPGSYKAVFNWKDILIYPLGSVNRSITVNFVADGQSQMNPGGPFIDSPKTQYYYQESSSPFPGIFSLIIISSIFVLIFYLVHRKQKRSPYSPRYYRLGQGPIYGNPNGQTQIRVASFCSNCGTKILANGQYCPDCGTKIE